MTIRLRGVVVLAVLVTACEIDNRPAAFVIPGPTVPSPLPTVPPYLWDTREELAIWTAHPVAHGSLAVDGSGPEAFIRIDRAEQEWLLRGPDLTPPVAGVQTLRIRYRWRPDANLPANASLSLVTTVHFQSTRPVVSYDPLAQGAASTTLRPRDEWTDVTFTPGQYKPPIEIEYCYLHSFGANRGVLEIDRIELVQ